MLGPVQETKMKKASCVPDQKGKGRKEGRANRWEDAVGRSTKK